MKNIHLIYRHTASVVLYLTRAAVLIGLIVVAYQVYELLISKIIDGDYIVPFILLWLLSAYIVLPRVHRRLTKLYLPSYFVGRARTGDGLLGDPINIAILGDEKTIHKAMVEAGWVQAEKLSLESTLKMIRSTVLRKSYPSAPVNSMYVFSRKQNFAYQQELNDNPHTRHHIRFWKTPKNWWLPGGSRADWVCAATLDTHVGISMLTGQITHKIEENTDSERDYVVNTLRNTGLVDVVDVQKHFTTAFHDRSGGGDMIRTDGSLPFVKLK